MFRKSLLNQEAKESKEVKVDSSDPAEVEKRMKGWFPNVSAAAISNLVKYYAELLKFNKTLNLISNATVKTADTVHFADSIYAARLIQPALIPEKPLYDFGSGNGMPGLVIAILYPNLKVILVDRDQRKMEFCKHIVSTLKLQNVSIQIQGIEDLQAGSCHNVVARGFAPFTKSLIICRKLFAKGGKFFHMKSDGWASEMAALPSQVFTHWTPSVVGKYKLPESPAEMFVVVTEKIGD